MKKIAFIGRKQGLKKWQFTIQGLEAERLQEEIALTTSELEIVDNLFDADLIQIRLNPEKTSTTVLQKALNILAKLPPTIQILNHPKHFSLYAEKHLAYRTWENTGLNSIPHLLWSFWIPIKQQIQQIREFTKEGAAYFRTHNEDSGKGIFYLTGKETTEQLKSIIYKLRWRSLTNRVSKSQALITREIQQESSVSRVFRVHMVKGKPIGGYALSSQKKIIHASDLDKNDLNNFIEANQQLIEWMQDPQWVANWQRAMQALGLDFAALEFFCVNNQPVFLEANPMWGGKHRFGSTEFTQWLKSDDANYLREKIPNVYNWLDANRFYQIFWRELANI